VSALIRYLLDARTATDHFPGIGRYAANLAQALTAITLALNPSSPCASSAKPKV